MEPLALFQLIQLVLRLLVYTFIGKGLLALLAGPGYRDNAIWRVFDMVTRPVWRATRALTPCGIGDGAIAWLSVAGLLLFNLVLYMVFYSQGWLTSSATP